VLVKVTIGLCVKNAERMIRDAVKSIISQDFSPEQMELLVVDGFSQDHTLSIIESIVSKEKIKYRIFRENAGLGTARQIVVENASGQFILWVDGDMILSKNYVSQQVNFMEKNETAGIAKGTYGLLEESSVVSTLENMEFVVDSIQYAGEITSNIALGTSGCIYRVNAIKQVGGFDEKLRGVGEDMDAESRLRAAGWALYVSPAVFYERRRGSWHSLWDEYFWHGRGAYSLYEKNKRALNLYNTLPIIAIIEEFRRSLLAYKIAKRKIVFLLPLHWIFKRIAWIIGLMNARISTSKQLKIP
jgi:glycosyltransferase involved in cell wall biosynthesis